MKSVPSNTVIEWMVQHCTKGYARFFLYWHLCAKWANPLKGRYGKFIGNCSSSATRMDVPFAVHMWLIPLWRRCNILNLSDLLMCYSAHVSLKTDLPHVPTPRPYQPLPCRLMLFWRRRNVPKLVRFVDLSANVCAVQFAQLTCKQGKVLYYKIWSF